MTRRTIFAAALVAPFLTVSAMAQNGHLHQGRPKTSIPHVMTQTTTATEAYAMVPKARVHIPHAYRGGPATVVPHSY